MFRFHIFLVLCLVGVMANAKPIDVKKAQAIAESFFETSHPRLVGGDLRMKSLSVPTLPYSVGLPTFYIFVPEKNRGFVIVSGEDSFPEVVGYSYDSPVEENSFPPALADWLKAFDSYVTDVRNGEASTYQVDNKEGKFIEPLIKTKWNQNKPYNDLLSNLYPTGCVATSMAQIMNYYEWPEQGVGILDGFLPDRHDRVDLSTYTYDWDNMLDEYHTKMVEGEFVPDNYSEIQAKAVATLMRDCGYAVDMEYTTSASAASIGKIVSALFEHFKYAPTVRYHLRSLYSKDKWVEMIRTELESGRPINYSGIASDDKIGHSFVCDGIDTNDFLHINWGWGDSYDGFFNMDVLAPEGAGIGGGTGSYIIWQGIVTGIRPATSEDEGKKPVGSLTLGGVSINLSEYEYPGYDYKIDINIKRIGNNSSIEQQVTIGVLWHETDHSEENLDVLKYVGSLESDHYYGNTSVSFAFRTDDFSVPGEYPFTLVNCKDASDVSGYDYYDTGEGISGGVLVVAEDGACSLKLTPQEANPAATLVSACSRGLVYENTSFILDVILKNEGKNSYIKELYLACVPEDVDESAIENYSEYVVGNYVDVEVYGQTQLKLPFRTRLSAGRYRVHLCWQDGTSFHPIPEISQQTLEVLKIPDYPVLIMDHSQLAIGDGKFKQERRVDVNVGIFVHALSEDYNGKLELWALKEGCEPSEEVLILSKDVYVDRMTEYLYGFYGSVDCFYNMELGSYNAYLKYEVNGKMQCIEGDFNQVTFEVVPSEKPDPFLVAPVVINDGYPVPMKSIITIEAQISSRAAFNGSIYLSSYGETEGNPFMLLDASALKVSLAAGETKTVQFKCKTVDPERTETQPVQGIYKIRINCVDEIYSELIGGIITNGYEESLLFEYTDQKPILSIVDHPKLDRGVDTYAGRKGMINFTVASEKTTDVTFGYYTYVEEQPDVPILQVEEQVEHFEAGEIREIKMPFICPEGTANGYYREFLYYSMEGQPALGILSHGGLIEVIDKPVGMPILSAPLVINEGNSVAPGSEGAVEVTVTSDNGFTGQILAIAYDSDGNEVLFCDIRDIILQAGVPQMKKLKYRCKENASTGTYKLIVYYSIMGRSFEVEYGDYEESAEFLIEPLVGQTEICLTEEPFGYLNSKENLFWVENLSVGSIVRVFSSDGRMIIESIATNTEMSIPMVRLEKGFYFVVMETSEGKTITQKVVLR